MTKGLFGPGGDTIDPPVPRFYTESHRAPQSSASKPDYPTQRTRRSTPPRNSPKTSNQCVADTLHVHDHGHGYSNRFNSAEVYILTHTIRSPMPSKDMKCRNKAHILHQPS